MLKGTKDGGTIALREVQFSGSVRSQIMADDAVDLSSKRLNGNCRAHV